MSDLLSQELAKRGLSGMATPSVPTGDPLQDEMNRRGLSSESIDETRGAPAGVRMTVGGVDDPESRLASLQTYYPDAKPYGKDNFIYKDPKTGRPTVYNPKGLDMGDVASQGRTVAQGIGGAMGGFFGLGAAAPEGFLTAPVSAPIGYGLGSQAGGQIFDLLGNAGGHRVDKRGIGQNLADTASGAMIDAIGAKIVPDAFKYIGDKFSSVKNRLAGTTPQETYDAFMRVGAKPSADIATGNRAIQIAANATRKSLGGSDVMQSSDDEMLNSMKSFAAETAQKYGPSLSPQGVGQVIEDASKGAVTRRMDKATELYDEAARLIPADLKHPPQFTVEYAHSMQSAPVAAELPNTAPTVQNKGVNSILSNFASDVLTPDGGVKPVSYQALKDLRTRVGKILGQPEIYSDFDTGQMKGLYKALSQDMETIADAAGPEAAKADALASRYFRRSIEENVKPLQSLVDKGAPEKIFNAAMAGTKDGDTGLRLMRRNFKPEQWDAIAGSTLNRMGLANPGAQSAEGSAFSPATFLTNWERMSPEAKQTLFYGKRYEGLSGALDDLVTTSAAIKDIGATENRPNTAGAMAALSALGLMGHALGGDVGALSGLAADIVTPYTAAKLMTSPRFVKWLSTATTSTAENPTGFASHLGGLVAIAKAEPELRQEIHEYMDAMRKQ